MELRGAQFRIPARLAGTALIALQRLASQSIYRHYEYGERMQAAAALDVALAEFGFAARRDGRGDVVIAGANPDDDVAATLFLERALVIISPFVARGSYLEFYDDEVPGVFRYVFTGQTVRQIAPTLVWRTVEELEVTG
jgi:hypothetical protein